MESASYTRRKIYNCDIIEAFSELLPFWLSRFPQAPSVKLNREQYQMLA